MKFREFCLRSKLNNKHRHTLADLINLQMKKKENDKTQNYLY